MTMRSASAKRSFLNISFKRELAQHELFEFDAFEERQFGHLFQFRLDLLSQPLVLRVEIGHLLVQVHHIDHGTGQTGDLGGYTQGIRGTVGEIVGNKDGLDGHVMDLNGMIG